MNNFELPEEYEKKQKELKERFLKRLKKTILALEQWKKDSLGSQIRY